MKEIYFDNAATSFPKPKVVADAVYNYITSIGANINRGNYHSAHKTEEIVFETRKKISKFFGCENSENVVFTKNITESINLVLNGLLKNGDHVIATQMDHNAVLRPLNNLKETRDIEFSLASCDRDGYLCLFTLEKLIKDNTKAIIVPHASNVCGTIFPLKEIGEICKKHSILLIVDAAQTAGIVPIDMKEIGIDILTFTGHKGLLGLQGIGGIVFNNEIYKDFSPLIFGGTGTMSDLPTMPEFLPDKFEAGTQNLPAICSLNSSIDYINETGIDNIFKKEKALKKLFIDNVKQLKGVEVIGYNEFVPSVAVVSLNLSCADNAELAEYLDTNYSIMTRCGLHCAPNAHKALGTFPKGTIRFSFNHFNTEEEILFACEKIKEFISLCSK